MKPADNGPLPTWIPGQYITVRIDHSINPTPPGNYSLSDPRGQNYFRISVKREMSLTPGVSAGLISTDLHDEVQIGDTLEIGPPCGEFTLNILEQCESTVVFLAGGFGVTPLLLIAKSLIASQPEAPRYFLQAARNSQTHAFRKELQKLKDNGQNVRTLTMYDCPLEEDREREDYDSNGVVDETIIRDWTPFESAEFYFCTPKPFMQNVFSCLHILNVPTDRIHFEFFGPRQDIESSVNS